MEKIESFKVDHLNLFSGLYVSRVDNFKGTIVTTFDLRFTAPNREEVLSSSAMHTLEHLGATYFRNSALKNDVVYFGPMGCKTGFYLVLANNFSSSDLFSYVIEFLDFVISFTGDIPGATAIECGNYKHQDLEISKQYAKKYKDDLINYKRLKY